MKGKIFATLAVALVFLAYAGFGSAYSFSVNSANSVIVLPTTKVVNDTPLHINEDAIAGAKLGAFLVLKGIKPSMYTDNVEVLVEYHSLPFGDDDALHYVEGSIMPDLSTEGLGIDGFTMAPPVGKKVAVRANLSKVHLNTSTKKVVFEDRAVEIIFNQNSTPLSLGDSQTVTVSTQVDGKDKMYIYSHDKRSDTAALGATLEVGGWKLTFQDIDVNQENTFVKITYPSGYTQNRILSKDKYYIFYIDANNNEDSEELNDASARVQALQEAGAKKIFVFSPTGFFVGIGGTKQVQYSYDYYEKLKEYSDGDVYTDQWVWDIDPANNLFTLYLHVDPAKNFPKVELVNNQWVPIPFGNLRLYVEIEKDNSGNVVDYSFRWAQTRKVKTQVQVQTINANVIDDVHKLIMNDEELTSLPSNKNVIIIGGWVSNKAWSLLEQVYGKSTIEEIKNEVMSEGYVVKILDNPSNPTYKVIILAGRGYPETAQAVEEFMQNA